MEHKMKLFEGPFNRIKSGKKIIEVRLFDKKRRRLNIKDKIIFSKLPNLEENLSVEIIGLLRYKSFSNLINDFPTGYFGHSKDYNKKDLVESIYKIYSMEDEQKYGVLGIRLKLV